MGIHYDYKSTRGAKAMEKQAKREKKLAEKRAKKQAKTGKKYQKYYDAILKPRGNATGFGINRLTKEDAESFYKYARQTSTPEGAKDFANKQKRNRKKALEYLNRALSLNPPAQEKIKISKLIRNTLK